MSNTNSETGRVRKVMTDIARGREEHGETELAFNPVTGRLEVVRRGQPLPDVVPATEIARDGFFGSREARR